MKSASKDKIETIFNFLRKEKRMPSYAEIAKILNLKSKDTAWRLVQKLISQGVLEKDSKGRLLPKDFKSIKLLGLVEAGFGSPTEESDLDKISLNDWLVEDDARTFMLKVKGDSMINAGIHPGDYCIVEKTSKASVGQIVVAAIDGAWTIKYLRQDKKGFYLEAANPKFKDLRPGEELQINAVVKAVVRKYE